MRFISRAYLQLGSAGDVTSNRWPERNKSGHQPAGWGSRRSSRGCRSSPHWLQAALVCGGRHYLGRNLSGGNNFNTPPHQSWAAPVCRRRFRSRKSGRSTGENGASPHQTPTTLEHRRGADRGKDRGSPQGKLRAEQHRGTQADTGTKAGWE